MGGGGAEGNVRKRKASQPERAWPKKKETEKEPYDKFLKVEIKKTSQ